MTTKLLLRGIISCAIFLGFSIFVFSSVEPIAGSSNDLSRLAGVIATIRYDTLMIDKTPQIVTRDKAFFEGHFYSSKPPFMSWVAGIGIEPVFSLVKPALLDNDIPIYKTATFINVSIPLILIAVLFMVSFGFIKNSLIATIFSIGGVLSTQLFSYTRYLNNHVPEALFSFIVFYLLFITGAPFKKEILRDGLLGIFLSLILAYDPSFLFIIFIVLVPTMVIKFKKTAIRHFITVFSFALPISIIHFFLTYKSFGILTVPQLYKDVYFTYPGSHFSNIKDPLNINVYSSPFPILIFNNLLGTHGIFLYMPALIFFFLYKDKRNWGWIFALSVLIVSVVAYSITSPNFGGWSYGNRRLIPVLPMLYYYAVLAFWGLKERSAKLLFVLALLTSIFFSYLGYKNTWFNKSLHINRDFAYFPLLYNLNKDYFKVFSYDP